MTTQAAINIRILDLDGSRLALAERDLRRKLKQHGVDAKIACVGCGLEIARQGFSGHTPALLMNQYTVSEGKELSEDVLETFCGQLLRWLSRQRES